MNTVTDDGRPTQRRRSIKGRSLGLSGLLAVALTAIAAIPAMAATWTTIPAATAGCPAPQLSQLLLPVGDANWYALAPGESTDNFTGAGWTLTGGAQIVAVTLADGATGSVLDLPSGSQAVSPAMCVASSYPMGRMMVRDLVGAQGVSFAVSYAGTKTATQPQNTGQVHGSHSDWTLANPVNLHPGNLPGWQRVQYTLTPGGKTGDVQIYNLYVDPRGA
jgi:hypothetical protein